MNNKARKHRSRSIKTILFLFFAIFMLGTANAAPDAYTIMTNPGEDASCEMRISWHTDLAIEDSYVEYTKKSDLQWVNAKRVAGKFTVCDTWNGIDTRIGSTRFTQEIILNKYGAELGDLEADTEYMYRVGSKELSDIRYFKTAGAKEFSFAWISDYHHYDPLPGRLTNAMNMINKVISINGGVDFILSTGDDVAYGGSHSYWKDMVLSKNYKDYMWVSTNGNHDNMDISDSKNTKAFFRDTHFNPRNGYAGQEGISYWFKYGNVLWIVLNTEDLNNAAQVPKAQEWVANVIRKNPAQYIFVVQHYQWLSGNSGSFSNNGFNRWNEFFDKWGVDFAFGGNEHIYARTHKLLNKVVSTDPKKGTVYLQNTSSDGDRGAAMPPQLSYNADKIAGRWSNGTSTVGGCLVTVNNKELKISLYDLSGTLHDAATISANREDLNTVPPKVVYVEPENKTSVKTAFPLDVVFSGKMNRSSVESAISFTPKATVSYSWTKDNIVSINISKLQASTAYVMKIDGSIAKNAENGKFLDGDNNGNEGGDYTLNFTTREEDLVAPEVVSYDPKNEQQDFLRPIVRLEFNKLLDLTYLMTDQLIVKDSSGKTVKGVQKYDEVTEKSVLHYYFNGDLTVNETYTVTLAPGIRCLSGNKMTQNLSFTFKATPRKTEKATILQPFTSIAGWSTAAQTGGQVAVSAEMDKNTTPITTGSGSLRMNYQWKENTTDVRRWRFNNGTANASLLNFTKNEHNTIQFYMFGDGSHTKFTLAIQRVNTGNGTTFYGKWIEIDWVGWKKVSWDLNDEAGLIYPLLGGEGPIPSDEPLCLKSLYVEASPGEYLEFNPGSFWISQVEALQLKGYANIIVSFNTMGGNETSSIYLSAGDKVIPPIEPLRDGYVFEGWCKDETCTRMWNFDTDVVTENTTIYAKWSVRLLPPNYVEPVQDESVTAKDYYTFKQQGDKIEHDWLNKNNIKRVINRSEKLYVLTKDAQPKIFVADSKTLNIINEIDLTGISGGTSTISDIAFTSDGYLLACNKENISLNDAVRFFKVYYWEDDNSSPTLYYKLTGAGANANWTEGTVGETMTVSGPIWDSMVYTTAVTTGTTKYIRVVGISKKYSNAPTTKYMLNATDYRETIWGTDYQFTISPRSADAFILTSSTITPTEFKFDISKPDRDPLINKGTFTEKSGYSIFKTNGASYFRYAKRSYMVAPIAKDGRVSACAVLFDITDGLNNAVKLSEELPSSGLGALVAPFMATYGIVENSDITMCLLAENQGFATFKTDGGLLVESITKNLNIRVFPIPAIDLINITGVEGKKSLKVVDYSGRTIKSIETDENTLDVSDINPGNYLLIINNITFKIIKK